MLKQYNNSNLKLVIQALRKQVDADLFSFAPLNEKSRIPQRYDFGWDSNDSEVKELLGKSLSDALSPQKILSLLGLHILTGKCNVLDRWRGLYRKTYAVIVPVSDKTVDEALSSNHVESHQALLHHILEFVDPDHLHIFE